MPRIRLLPEAVINRIAAGEVVERPASVVKELVENALDAGAGTVTVRLEEGGTAAVEVSDDGCGMDAEDALLALERHATSKLDAEATLEAITTLGFRGEALPAIAAVSHLILETATTAGEGTRVECHFGALRGVRPCARPRGTRVEVRDLFARLPARRKFLRSPDTELRHVVATLTGMALLQPTVAWCLLHNGRPLLQLPAAADLFSRLPDLLGAQRAAAATPVQHARGDARLHGFLIPARGAGGQLTLAVNGRLVRDRFLAAVVHRTLRGSGPALEVEGFLHLLLPPRQVDVNVHPTKAEVRFADPAAVAALLNAALAAALPHCRPEVPVPRLVAVERPWEGPSSLTLAYPPPPPAPAVAEPPPAPADSPPPGRVLGVYRNTYLVVEDAEGLLLVDQHAAHERVLYEELLARDEAVPLQPLLLPVVVELRPEHAALAAELAPALASLGLEVEPLSGTAVRVLAAPRPLAPEGLQQLLPEILAEVDAGAAPGATARQRLAAALACRAAVQKHVALSPAEAEHLLLRLARTDNPHRCPHGRPIALRLPHGEIERRIGRR